MTSSEHTAERETSVSNTKIERFCMVEAESDAVWSEFCVLDDEAKDEQAGKMQADPARPSNAAPKKDLRDNGRDIIFCFSFSPRFTEREMSARAGGSDSIACAHFLKVSVSEHYTNHR